MKIAYLIDRDSLGGGMEYIRRKIAARPADECRVFFSARGECSPRQMNVWGAEEIVVNHLKALLQLLGNPFRRPKGRVTFVVHGIHLRKYVWRRNEGGGLIEAALPFWLRRGLEAWLYHRCDRIVALTPTDRDDILRLYGRGLRVDVEPNTLDGWVAKLSDSLPAGIEGPFKYLCIGRFDYPKGQDRWIGKIGNREQGTGNRETGRTLFIGDGPTLAECKRLAEKLGVEDLCVFAGAIPGAERCLKCAEVVVSPSRWEGMPYLMMKARALGCWILATDCPGNRDVLAGYEKWEKLEL